MKKITQEFEFLSREKDSLSHEKKFLSREEDSFSHGKGFISRENISFSRKANSVSCEIISISHEKKIVSHEKKSFSREREIKSHKDMKFISTVKEYAGKKSFITSYTRVHTYLAPRLSHIIKPLHPAFPKTSFNVVNLKVESLRAGL
jgi:hypothetical protein